MTIEIRKSCAAVTCDGPDCHMEVLGPTDDDACEDASLIGWKFVDGGERHICPDCLRGKLPAAARARATYGTDTVVLPEAPRDVAEGEEVLAPGGIKVGKAAHDAKKGEPLRIALYVPEPGEAPQGGAQADQDSELKIEEAPLELGGARATRWDPGDVN